MAKAEWQRMALEAAQQLLEQAKQIRAEDFVSDASDSADPRRIDFLIERTRASAVFEFTGKLLREYVAGED